MFGVPNENILTMEVFNRSVGHYTQVAWQSSDKIGCAVEWCPSMTLVGCEYNLAGNRLNHLIYDIGHPCTTDEDCQCTVCTCSRDVALCIPPGYATVMPPTAVKTTPRPYDTNSKTGLLHKGRFSWPWAQCFRFCCFLGGTCPGLNTGMTDEARKMFVDKHNEYRNTQSMNDDKLSASFNALLLDSDEDLEVSAVDYDDVLLVDDDVEESDDDTQEGQF
ncbi:hypothetical protein V3C99_007998 [Haemonchus contortus]|uniref:SCP domain-containing protein n=1 Tax=Haemonchus contortus TaxID=6289 RepID=A0A7I4YM35_HAECO